MGRKTSSGTSKKAEYVLNFDVIGGFVITGKPIETDRVVVCIFCYFKLCAEGLKFQRLEI